MIRVLVACEKSGVVRDAFAGCGFDAWSCDLEPSDAPGQHIQGDAARVIGWGWDAMIAHPECTFLTVSANSWLRDDARARPGVPTGAARRAEREKAVAFFLALWNAPIPVVVIENPVGVMSTRLRKPDQYIQPHDFGEDASKTTGLWIRGGLRPLVGTRYVPPRIVTINGKQYQRWANQTDSGQNRLAPSSGRSAARAKTYHGVAEAMASQWGPQLRALMAERQSITQPQAATA